MEKEKLINQLFERYMLFSRIKKDEVELLQRIKNDLQNLNIETLQYMLYFGERQH